MNDSVHIALDFKQVSKQFITAKRTVKALQGISLRVSEGAIVALVGPDGAGKTTLMRLAAGLLLPNSGIIHVFGFDTDRQADSIHALIGYMPQRFGLYEDLSVAENLNLYSNLHSVSKLERQQRFSELMEMTGLAPFTTRLAGRLSGGMKQKLGLACTLLSQPRILLLDEPSVGVDPVSRRELWKIIDHQVKKNGMTVLLSTAYLDEAERCTDVVLMDNGEILDQNSPEFFGNKMQGHCFLVNHTDYSNRQLQKLLSEQQGITDVIIQGEKLRIITDTPDPSTLNFFKNNTSKLTIATTKPRLEDAFIALLRERYPPTKMPEIKNTKIADTEMTKEVIRVDGVDRWFGNFQAVKKLNFTVNRGEIFGLLGANGAGKTTTFRMLCGLLPVSNGQLSVAGVDLRKAAARARAKISYMSQKFSLYGNLSVMQNLEFFSSAYGLKNQRRQQRIQWALEQFQLKSAQNNDSGDLPLGYKQRLAMACALMHEPEILFLDEPTSGVDPLARREFWNRTNLLAASGVTIL